MSNIPKPVYLAAKFLYYSIFNAFSSMRLRRNPNHISASGPSRPPSINIVSYYGWQNGISQGALMQKVPFEMLGYSVDLVDVTRAMANPFVSIKCSRSDIFITHCAGTHFLRAAWPLRRVLPYGKVVGYFAWEFAEPPRDWPNSRFLWDEIWTPSSFAARALAQWCDCPIKVVPHVLVREATTPRKWRKGEEPLVFLAMADARSSLSRKNPRGAVKAFQLAFPSERDVELVVKLHGTAIRSSPELDRLLAGIELDSRILLINRIMTPDELNELFLDSHALVSLHRAEGFGLPLLEAQTHGLATIATGWSGNLDFTTDDNSVLIPYTLTTTRDEGGVYGDVTWAEPHIESAATAMRTFYGEPNELARVATAGWEASRPKRQLERFAKSLEHTLLGDWTK